MKELDFQPHKSNEDFRKNYRLHDIAESCGKSLLIQWGIKFDLFGKDRRYEKVWEKEKTSRPFISYKGKKRYLIGKVNTHQMDNE
jgi:hypothetical protein